MNLKCCLKPEEKSLCTCAYEELFDVIGKKWAVVILNLLRSHESLGYNKIFNKISGITPKAFGDKLKLLEERRLIARRITEKPLRTIYTLTDEGRNLSGHLLSIFEAPKEPSS